MSQREFYKEFFQSIYLFCQQYINELEAGNKGLFLLGPYNTKDSLIIDLYNTSLWTYNWKDRYNELRKEENSIEHIYSLYKEELNNLIQPIDLGFNNSAKPKSDDHPLEELLKPYKDRILIYCINQRHIDYMLPLLRNITQPSILLLEENLIEPDDLPDNMLVLEYSLLKETYFNNDFLQNKFTTIFYYYNTYDILIRYLSPKSIVFLEGGHLQGRILAEVAQRYECVSYCIQQGWPSLFHPNFRDFPYTYFLTWGKRFCELWQMYNSYPQFIPAGYMYSTGKHIKANPSKIITFFLQAPFFISDERYFNDYINLIIKTKNRNKECIVQVREHPAFRLSLKVINTLHYENIVVVSDFELRDVFNSTDIVVSHFSSVIMECMIYGCIPLVFDPTVDSSYYPDIEKEGMGFISKTYHDFFQKLDILLSFPNNFLDRINALKHSFFEGKGDEAVCKILTIINN